MTTLTWLHFGDLHVTDDDDLEGLRRFETLIADANAHLGQGIDFAILPGDNANNGTPRQYGLIRDAVAKLQLPLHVIPGDHDFEPGSLANFYRELGAQPLPASEVIRGRRCLFLDLVSAGEGGPDFRLGQSQTAWLQRELDEARSGKQQVAIFMHAYPGDLADDGERIGRLFAEHEVLAVDTGHTHYNELLNDGRVIYAATRSTGQIEEDAGEPGFSIATLDGATVSWRFKRLSAAWPLVLITSPADCRLATQHNQGDWSPAGDVEIRAKIFGHATAAQVLIADRAPVTMKPVAGEAALWSAVVPALGEGAHRIVVEATGADGVRTRDEIQVSDAPRAWHDALPGTDEHTIGEWTARGLLGSQLGPNKNGRGW